MIGSLTSGPDTTLSILAISHADLANTAGESKEVEDGNMPARDSNPVEVLKPYRAVKDAGQLIEP